MYQTKDPVDIAEINYDLQQQAAESAYQERPDADWDDIREVLGTDLIDSVSESLGADAYDQKDWSSKWDAHCDKVFEHITNGGSTDAELGKLIRELAAPYIIRSAQSRLAIRANVKSDIEDIKQALEVN